MIVAFVVAMAENGVIGREGQLPWRMPSHLKRFRKLTLGKPVIMGRKTYESIGKPLDGRDNIVVTRRPELHISGVHIAASVEDAIERGRELADKRGVNEVVVIGGEGLFRAAPPTLAPIFPPLGRAPPPATPLFPIPDAPAWRETAREPMPQGSGD